MKTIHATTIDFEGKGVLLTGASGSGKSALALQMMALGARLVADDRTEVSRNKEHLMARCPQTIRGVIEARGVGLLSAEVVEETRIVLVVDLDQTETCRLPLRHDVSFLGVRVQCLHKTDSPCFPAVLIQYLKGGRREPT